MDQLGSISAPRTASGHKNGARRLLMAATAAALALNFIPGAAIVTYPIRLFTTLIHEGGHAVATILSGGQVIEIGIDPSGSGVTRSLGGFGPQVYMAGYVGAMLFGALSLHLARRPARTKPGRSGLLLMAAVTLIITGLWVHPWISPFGFAAGLVIAGLLFGASRFLPERGAHFAVSFLGVQLCLNSLYDVRDLLFMTTHSAADNDAVFMARAYGLTPWFWASLWALMAIVILGASLRAYWRSN